MNLANLNLVLDVMDLSDLWRGASMFQTFRKGPYFTLERAVLTWRVPPVTSQSTVSEMRRLWLKVNSFPAIKTPDIIFVFISNPYTRLNSGLLRSPAVSTIPGVLQVSDIIQMYGVISGEVDKAVEILKELGFDSS